DLAIKLSGAADRLPQREEVSLWAANLEQWADLMQRQLPEMPESLTLQTLCSEVAQCGTLQELSRIVGSDVSPVEFLNLLYALLEKGRTPDLLNQWRVLANQNGSLCKLTELRRDDGIDELLKDIVEDLGIPVRADIVDRSLSCRQLAELAVKS